MKIRVLYKPFIWYKQNGLPMKKHGEVEDLIFYFENGYVFLRGSYWRKPCDSLENCFKAIKSYFYGTNNDIVDFLQMVE